MASKITVPLDEELLRRARLEDASGADKSDEQVVEDALSVYLGLRALEDSRAQGSLSAAEATLVERDGRLVIPPTGAPIDDELVRSLRDAGRR